MMTRPAALSKADASKALSAEVETWISDAIRIINLKLMNFNPGSQRLVHDSEVDLRNLSSDAQARAIEEVMNYYITAGWKVTHTFGDQRDNGGWFTFS